jgi:transcriptional regulator with PAS, ATPase and Fis domain
LDEVGEMSPKVQVDLLRVLEEKAFYRLGGNRKIHTDVRVITATNKILKKGIEEGSFREDLYYRLNVVGIHLPPLRERKDDVLLLADYFLKKFCMKMNKKKDGFSPEVIKLFLRYKWPGNIRELENAIERAVVVGKGPLVHLQDMPFGGGQELSKEKTAKSLRGAEKKHILQMLDETGWNVTRSANLLEIDRATLYNKIKNYGLSKPKNRR